MYAIYNEFNHMIYKTDDYYRCAALAEEIGILDGEICDIVDMTTGEILVSYRDGECTWRA